MFPIVTIPRREKDKDTQKPPQEPSLGAPILTKDSRRFVNGMSLTVAIFVWVAGLIGTIVVGETMGRDDLIPAVLLPAVLIGLYLLFAIKVADQWEKAVILRFGRFRGLKGPGLFWIIPVVDVISHLVDQRVRVTDVTAESALTRDTVPVNVDAIVFWLVWDAREVHARGAGLQTRSLSSAQTALRESIGRHELARDDHGARKARPGAAADPGREDQPVGDHGAVGRDPRRADPRRSLRTRCRGRRRPSASGRPASFWAPRRRRSQASSRKARRALPGQPGRLHLRAMNMLYEAIKEKGSMVIVPSSAVETMGLGGMLGTTALSGVTQQPPAKP